jgi:hypothetical protein
MHPADCKYMGLLHPETEVMYQYQGLHMGSGNSSALAGQYGTALMRRLKERCPLFQGTTRENTWSSAFQEELTYDGKIGQRLVYYYREDNLPVALI